MNKATFIKFINSHLISKMEVIRGQIQELSESNDVKSSAGDKHETSKSLAQLEQEKLGMILLELENNLKFLQKIIPEKHNKVQVGSLFQLDEQFYFIGVAVGSLHLEGKTIFCMSAKAPLSQQCIGKEKNHRFTWLGFDKTIIEVY